VAARRIALQVSNENDADSATMPSTESRQSAKTSGLKALKLFREGREFVREWRGEIGCAGNSRAKECRVSSRCDA